MTDFTLSSQQRLTLACAAELLRYPEEDMWVMLPDIREHANALPPEVSQHLIGFIDHMEQDGLKAVQSEHVNSFDLTENLSMSLAWHRYGNDPKLGRAYAALNELYRDAGFEPAQGELPDYLPRVLEFMSLAPEWATGVVLDGFGKQLAMLRDRLVQVDNPYAGIVCAAADALRLDEYHSRPGAAATDVTETRPGTSPVTDARTSALTNAGKQNSPDSEQAVPRQAEWSGPTRSRQGV